MIIVKPRILKVKFSDGTSTYYASLTKRVEAIKSYSVEDLGKIEDMKLIWPGEPTDPIQEDW